MAKLSKAEAANYRTFGSTASLFAGLIKLSPVGGAQFEGTRNALAAYAILIGLGSVIAGWRKQSNIISDYLVPNIIKEW